MSLSYSCNYRPETIPDERNMYTYRNANMFKTQTYSKYSDIAGGYIKYHENQRPTQEIFKKPVFINDYTLTAKMYRDPMGSLKPSYTVCKKKDNITLKGQPKDIKDTTEWREEMMALQMRKHNQINYEPKWNML